MSKSNLTDEYLDNLFQEFVDNPTPENESALTKAFDEHCIQNIIKLLAKDGKQRAFAFLERQKLTELKRIASYLSIRTTKRKMTLVLDIMRQIDTC